MPLSGSLARQRRTYSKRTRVTGVTGDQTVKATPGILGRLIVRNLTAAATLTLKDGATTLIVLDIPVTSNGPVVVPLDLQMTTSIIVSPSASTIDCLVIYD